MEQLGVLGYLKMPNENAGGFTLLLCISFFKSRISSENVPAVKTQYEIKKEINHDDEETDVTSPDNISQEWI